jgi:alpha-tubulin suppressor-like RCC1 family protein
VGDTLFQKDLDEIIVCNGPAAGDITAGAWGANNYGMLGDGTTNDSSSPVQVATGVGGNVGTDGGWYFQLFIKSNGSLWTVGHNNQGQLGLGDTTDRHSPVQVASSYDVTAASGGRYHAHFVKSDGSLHAMGYNNYGQLGDGNTTTRLSPVQILASGSNVTQITEGTQHSLFLKSDGSLWAMGYNGYGQLGDGTQTDRHTPVQVVASGVTQITGGGYHSLFIKSDGSLWAMGDNTFGQLGDGTTTNRYSPVQILASGVTQVAGGSDHSLFVKTDGSLWGMGNNSKGRLGDGTETTRYSPVQVVSSGVTQVAAGGSHSLILKGNTLWATGNNAQGQLGDGTTTDRHSPVQVDTGVSEIATGLHFSSVLYGAPTWASYKPRGKYVLWGVGSNYYARIANPSTGGLYQGYVQMAEDVKAVISNSRQSLIIKTDDSLWARGRFKYNVGLGPNVPNDVFDTTGVTHSVSKCRTSDDGGMTFVIYDDGQLWGTGTNIYGELGTGVGGVEDRLIHVDDDVADIAITNNTVVYLKTNGTLWTTGSNMDGARGDGTRASFSNPSLGIQQLTAHGTGIVALAGGSEHIIYLESSGRAFACGYNLFGQCGVPSTQWELSPVQVYPSGVTHVDAGLNHTMFRHSSINDSAWVLGGNSDGQLGNGGTTDTHVPYMAISSGVSQISCGDSCTHVIKDDGSLWGWGNQFSGGVGDPATAPTIGVQDAFDGVDVTTPTHIADNVLSVSSGDATLIVADHGFVPPT